MNLGLHVISFPSGRFGYVGNIPHALCESVPANVSAVCGGRAFRDPDTGELREWKAPSFPTQAEAVEFAKGRGFSPMVNNVPQ